MNFIVTLAALAMVFGAGSTPADPPPSAKLIEQIPIHPGAAPAPKNDTLPVPRLGFTLETQRLYVVNASPEAVVEFYRSRLSAREVTETEFDTAIEKAEAGELESVLFTFNPPDFKSRAALQTKGAIEKRPPYREGLWVNWARFTWSRRQPNGDVTQYGIGIVDGSDARRAEPQTVLLLAAGAPNEVADEVSAADEEEAAEEDSSPSAPLTEPSAAALGVPRYPGAVFDGRNSAGMSSDEERYFIYTTVDPLEKVVAFYELRTGKKATRTEDGALIAIRGTGLFPELGVAIQPNAGAYPSSVKTLVTVRHGEGPSQQ